MAILKGWKTVERDCQKSLQEWRFLLGDAFVTPVKVNGEVVGYESVRCKPSKAQIDRAEAVYNRINKGKSRVPKTDRFNAIPFGLIANIALVVAAVMLTNFLSPLVGLLPIAGLALSYQFDKRKLNQVLIHARSVTHDPLAAYIFTSRIDHVGEALLAYQHLHVFPHILLIFFE